MPCRQAKLLVPVLLLKSSRRSCANDAPCRCKGRVDADRSHLVDTITMNMAVCVVVSVLMSMPTSKTQQDPTAVIFMNAYGYSITTIYTCIYCKYTRNKGYKFAVN